MDEQWTSLDLTVTIVNRKKSYQIPKEKLSSIPYFVKLFSDPNFDLIKIELDLDESSFDNIVAFILSNHLSISMESAFSMMETADYLGMDEIKQKYYDLYQSNFNIKVLNDYLDFYDYEHNFPKMFDEEKLNSFIGKYFLPISNTKAFLKFPVALLERILSLKLIVSYEYQIVEAIDRWIKFDEKDRKQQLPRLIKFVNFCHLNKGQMQNVANTLENSGFSIYTLQLKIHSFHACGPKFCETDCESTRHYYKSLIAIYELDEDKIEIRRRSKSNLWIGPDQFDRDETISSSLIEADHISDIIYDCGRKGIRVDWITKKFKYLKMFGDENSYYGQVYKYITNDISAKPKSWVIKDLETRDAHGVSSNSTRLESICLDNHLEGICYTVCSSEKPHASNIYPHARRSLYPAPDDSVKKQYILSYLDYRKFSSFTFQGPTETRSCFINYSFQNRKVLYFLTKHDFSYSSCDGQSSSKNLNYSFLKSFIGSDSLDHIELISHNNSVLICNKQTKSIYCYVEDTDSWQLMSKIESPEKMIAIASINLTIDSE